MNNIDLKALLQQLLHQLQSSDPKECNRAISRVAVQFGSMLLVHARLLVDDEHAAEDILQKALMKLPDKVRDREFLTVSFLKGMISQECQNHRRAKKREKIAMIEMGSNRNCDGEAARFDPVDSRELRPDVLVEQLELLRTAWDQLKPDEREVITLRSLTEWEMTQKQVADQMGFSVETVRGREKRAWQRLRKLLSENGAEFGDPPERSDSERSL